MLARALPREAGREGRLADDDGLRQDEIVGRLGLDFARAGRTREGGDFSIRIPGRKGKRSRRGLRDQQEQSQRADVALLAESAANTNGPRRRRAGVSCYRFRFALFFYHNIFHSFVVSALLTGAKSRQRWRLPITRVIGDLLAPNESGSQLCGWEK